MFVIFFAISYGTLLKIILNIADYELFTMHNVVINSVSVYIFIMIITLYVTHNKNITLLLNL
jgi:hypothetical protein